MQWGENGGQFLRMVAPRLNSKHPDHQTGGAPGPSVVKFHLGVGQRSNDTRGGRSKRRGAGGGGVGDKVQNGLLGGPKHNTKKPKPVGGVVYLQKKKKAGDFWARSGRGNRRVTFSTRARTKRWRGGEFRTAGGRIQGSHLRWDPAGEKTPKKKKPLRTKNLSYLKAKQQNKPSQTSKKKRQAGVTSRLWKGHRLPGPPCSRGGEPNEIRTAKIRGRPGRGGRDPWGGNPGGGEKPGEKGAKNQGGGKNKKNGPIAEFKDKGGLNGGCRPYDKTVRQGAGTLLNGGVDTGTSGRHVGASGRGGRGEKHGAQKKTWDGWRATRGSNGFVTLLGGGV